MVDRAAPDQAIGRGHGLDQAHDLGVGERSGVIGGSKVRISKSSPPAPAACTPSSAALRVMTLAEPGFTIPERDDFTAFIDPSETDQADLRQGQSSVAPSVAQPTLPSRRSRIGRSFTC